MSEKELLEILKQQYIAILKVITMSLKKDGEKSDTEIEKYEDAFDGMKSLDEIHGWFQHCLSSIQMSSGHENDQSMSEMNENLLKEANIIIEMARNNDFRLMASKIRELCENVAQTYTQLGKSINNVSFLNGSSVKNFAVRMDEPPIVTYTFTQNGKSITCEEYRNGAVSYTRIKNGETRESTVTFTPNENGEYEVRDKVCISKNLLKTVVEDEEKATEQFHCYRVDKDGTQHFCTAEEHETKKREERIRRIINGSVKDRKINMDINDIL